MCDQKEVFEQGGIIDLVAVKVHKIEYLYYLKGNLQNLELPISSKRNSKFSWLPCFPGNARRSKESHGRSCFMKEFLSVVVVQYLCIVWLLLNTCTSLTRTCFLLPGSVD